MSFLQGLSCSLGGLPVSSRDSKSISLPPQGHVVYDCTTVCTIGRLRDFREDPDVAPIRSPVPRRRNSMRAASWPVACSAWKKDGMYEIAHYQRSSVSPIPDGMLDEARLWYSTTPNRSSPSNDRCCCGWAGNGSTNNNYLCTAER